MSTGLSVVCSSDVDLLPDASALLDDGAGVRSFGGGARLLEGGSVPFNWVT